ncbi:hypothetical protein NP493_81g03020 [Ridgeia piscesae]|uniref:Uncharacterized protein n=1 Tax=Ridgeia piscesae TaxID=27915 RepID=A0AAD9P9K7_RIDPI|nr:hypothetical protein NP493_81g03020 [Ridgeia piscesae]
MTPDATETAVLGGVSLLSLILSDVNKQLRSLTCHDFVNLPHLRSATFCLSQLGELSGDAGETWAAGLALSLIPVRCNHSTKAQEVFTGTPQTHCGCFLHCDKLDPSPSNNACYNAVTAPVKPNFIYRSTFGIIPYEQQTRKMSCEYYRRECLP